MNEDLKWRSIDSVQADTDALQKTKIIKNLHEIIMVIFYIFFNGNFRLKNLSKFYIFCQQQNLYSNLQCQCVWEKIHVSAINLLNSFKVLSITVKKSLDFHDVVVPFSPTL